MRFGEAPFLSCFLSKFISFAALVRISLEFMKLYTNRLSYPFLVFFKLTSLTTCMSTSSVVGGVGTLLNLGRHTTISTVTAYPGPKITVDWFSLWFQRPMTFVATTTVMTIPCTHFR